MGVANDLNGPIAVAVGLFMNPRHLPKGVPNDSDEARVVARGLSENWQEPPPPTA
jgi:hypothetical protein